MKPGDLVRLDWIGDSYPLLKNPNIDVEVDLVRKNELSLVLKASKYSVKLLSPRGRIGWIWKPRVEVVT